MLFSRILGGVGRAMIAGGVLLLLFVAYQLWGTGLRTSAAQDSLQQRFADQVAETSSRPPATAAPTTTTTDPAAVPPTSGAAGVPVNPEGFVAPRPGDPIGRIQIPKIGADFTIIEGVDLRWLQEGPGHFPGTPLPGQPGNSAIAGHRTTWLAPFNRIDELVPLDLITITTLQGTFTYEVGAEPKIVSPTQVEILDQVPGQNTLTLMACHPKYSAAQRIVVTARLISNPAPLTAPSAESARAAEAPTDEALFGGSEDLVGGDSSATAAAILWGLVAAVVWLVAWLIARAWPSWREPKRWLVFGAGFVVFLVPLFLAFENVNRLLPAGY